MPLPAALRIRLAAEDGFAVPTVMLAMFASFALASAVVISSVDAQRGTVRDQSTKTAFAAAETGIANAMLRFNRIQPTEPCAPVGGTAVAANGWCPVEMSGAIDRGGFTYMVRPSPTELEVVATGIVDGVTRRVSAVAQSAQGGSKGIMPFGTANVIGLDGITLNSNASITADIATNGNLMLNSNAVIDCDHAGYGVGKGITKNSNSSITCTPVQETTSLPPVNPGDVMTKNSNSRICNLDPLSPASSCPWAWDPSRKRLTLNSGGALTLGAAGGEFNYAFCQIILNSNSYLHIASGATVRIYFGAPEECQNESNPLILNSNSKIMPTGSGAADLALLVVGSESRTTQITLNSNAILFDCEQRFVLYAPRTNVTLNSNISLCGGLASKSILANSNAHITAENTVSDFELPHTESQYFIGYGPPDFVECTSASPSSSAPPDTGC